MACADKMYFNQEEYSQIKKLWRETRDKQIKELGSEIWMLPFSYYDKDSDRNYLEHDDEIEEVGSNSSIFNVSTKTELWLLKNFDLPCIKREVFKQLGSFSYKEIEHKFKEEWISLLNFSEDDFIYSIHRGDDELWFYKFPTDDEITVYDEFYVFGTTKIFEFYHKSIELPCYMNDESIEIYFNWCGLDLFIKNNEMFISVGENDYPIYIPYLRFSPKYTFKHCYDINDVASDEIDCEQIVISGNQIYSMNDVDKSTLKREIFFLPEYIQNLIKT